VVPFKNGKNGKKWLAKMVKNGLQLTTLIAPVILELEKSS